MLALALMIAQAFLFNAVFFSYALVLVRFQGVPGEGTGLHLVTLAARNFLSPLLVGHFFDTIGRRVMITATYAIGGVLLVPFGGGELHDPVLHRIAQAFLFNAVFFSYALVLVRFQGVPGEGTGLHLVTLAASNFLSPLLLGHFFDTIGRRVMITATYAIGGVLLVPFGGGELHDPVLHRIAQAFLFNAVFFSYALVLVRFQGVPGEGTGLHLVTLAASNFLSPLLLGHFFDTIGRRVMITATYAIG